MTRPAIAVYLTGWGRPGDTALVADDRSGRLLGAAWFRLFSKEEHGFGFLSPDVPELTIAIQYGERGRGIGTALLQALIQQAAADGYGALSLSGEEDNPALRLYERRGSFAFAKSRMRGLCGLSLTVPPSPSPPFRKR